MTTREQPFLPPLAIPTTIVPPFLPPFFAILPGILPQTRLNKRAVNLSKLPQIPKGYQSRHSPDEDPTFRKTTCRRPRTSQNLVASETNGTASMASRRILDEVPEPFLQLFFVFSSRHSSGYSSACKRLPSRLQRSMGSHIIASAILTHILRPFFDRIGGSIAYSGIARLPGIHPIARAST